MNIKLEYNKLLQRENKAKLYLDNKNIDIEIIEKKYIPEYKKVTRELSKILNEIKIYSVQEALEGFKI
jgi:hypothetical protein